MVAISDIIIHLLKEIPDIFVGDMVGGSLWISKNQEKISDAKISISGEIIHVQMYHYYNSAGLKHDDYHYYFDINDPTSIDEFMQLIRSTEW